MTLGQMFLREMDEESKSTRKLLSLVPFDKADWKPHPKSMALGRLASHIAEMGGWVSATINLDKIEISPADKPFLAKSSEELMAAFEKNLADARTALETASDEHFRGTWSLIYGGQTVFSLPRVSVMRGPVFNHLVHHRAQLTVYLRLLDVPIPGMYGPSADDQGK